MWPGNGRRKRGKNEARPGRLGCKDGKRGARGIVFNRLVTLKEMRIRQAATVRAAAGRRKWSKLRELRTGCTVECL